jgi:hypothetical protein
VDLIQARYARWLAIASRTSLVLLVIAYAAYVLRLVPAHVPIERLPELWRLPASEFLQRTGGRPGWDWARFIATGDMLSLAALALLISSSILCLLAVMPLFRKAGERLFVWICALQVAVLLVAASGWLGR